MGKDFKIGLMAGVVLGFVALVWMATRPSQSPEARILGPQTASLQETLPLGILPASTRREAEPDSGAAQGTSPVNALPPSLTTNEPTHPRESAPLPEPEPHITTPEPQPHPVEQEATPEEEREKITTTRFHVVQRGETLSAISQKYYGSAHRWQRILEANQDTIKDANKISPGTKLIIPW